MILILNFRLEYGFAGEALEILAINLKKFKQLREVEILTPPLTIVVGGNNSGKSSLLQGIHFAITVLQSARSSAEGGKSMSTLGYDQFIYRPAGDLIGLHHGGPTTSKVGPLFSFTFKDAGDTEPQEFKLQLLRGKNANLATIFERKSTFFTRASDRTKPFSILVPGLAGVPLREEKRTPSIVTNGIAQGDSNIYLRNVLLSIISDGVKLERFHEIINSIFPGLRISTAFKDDIHLYIDIMVKLGENELPLEMIGTGCLQAIQLVAYVTAYDPALLLLDEPDAHLHPSNQRMLASTLQRITESSPTKIIVASHSRHMFDALTFSGASQIVWLKDGRKQTMDDRSSLSILLDLGALDSYELMQNGAKRLVFLTEDTKLNKIHIFLKANGFEEKDYFIQPLHGVNNISAAVPIADFFTRQGGDTFVVVHRDGDGMTIEEKEWWSDAESKKIPDRTHIFVTKYTDVEHYFCQPAHISEVYNIDIEDAKNIVDDILKENTAKFMINFAHKRQNLKSTALKAFAGSASTEDLVGNIIDFWQAKGKTLLPLVLEALQAAGHNPNHLISKTSSALEDSKLQGVLALLSAQGGAGTGLPVGSSATEIAHAP